SGSPIYSVAGKKSEAIPLQLISPEGLSREPRLVPLQLHTGDASLDALLASTTFHVEGVDVSSGDVELNLGPGEQKQLTFVLEDGNGLLVRKALTFDSDRYPVDLSLVMKRGDTPIPGVKVTIGPSIGDQGVGHHTFYSVAPEAVAYVGDKLHRNVAAKINSDGSSPDRLILNGPIDWAGVADTYFAMVAIPPQRQDGLEYRTVAYEFKPKTGTAEKRYLVTAFVPVPTDGSRTIIYAGPKDHYLLTEASKLVSQAVQRAIDLE